LFNLEKGWLIGKTILSNNDLSSLNHIFELKENKDDDDTVCDLFFCIN
jgi:hypothetical protein